MAEQYWIGGFFIDLPRNQITHNGQTITLAPKALAVLTCLAEQQGQVVSQDTLLEKVWPNSVVSPNTLQRSIAQLRKALGDDGKGQQYIKTHAKKTQLAEGIVPRIARLYRIVDFLQRHPWAIIHYSYFSYA